MGLISFLLSKADGSNKNNKKTRNSIFSENTMNKRNNTSKFSEGDTVEIISTGEVGRIIGVHGSIYEVEIFSAGEDVDRVAESDLKLY